MKSKMVYICDVCGRMFDDEGACALHEEGHTIDIAMAIRVLEQMEIGHASCDNCPRSDYQDYTVGCRNCRPDTKRVLLDFLKAHYKEHKNQHN